MACSHPPNYTEERQFLQALFLHESLGTYWKHRPFEHMSRAKFTFLPRIERVFKPEVIENNWYVMGNRHSDRLKLRRSSGSKIIWTV